MDNPILWWVTGLALFLAGLLIFVRRRYVVPGRIVRLGMELLSAQDTNNRLRLTGNPAADRVARLFNSLMERLGEQTLINRRQHRLLSELIAASPMGVVMLDYDGRITDLNPAAMRFLVTDSASAIRKRPGELQSRLGRALEELPKGKSTLRISETEIYLCRRLEFIDSGFKRPFILIDNMADELRQAEKEAYGKIIRIMAHEVNNTMGGLRSVLDLLMESSSSDPSLAEVIRSGEESCRRLGEFVDSYAEVARIPEPEKKRLELGLYLQGLLPFLQSMAVDRADVRIATGASDVCVMADPALLERVLVNIVKNAVEAMPEGKCGLIELDFSADREGARLTVSNDGRPIPESDGDSLFSPFYTTKPGGRGTGLALVAEILARHGWHYTLSTGSDGITRFVILFWI